MKKIRSGNDAKICWTITKNVAVGDAIDLHDAEVLLIDALKHPATFAYTINTINDYTVQVVGTFYGKDQCTKGKYNLLLVKNRGQVDMITLDYIDAFILTGPSKFGVVSGNDEGEIKTACVRLDTEYESYIGGPDMQNYYTKDEIDAMFETNQADWTEDDTTSPSYIKNKPEVYTQSEVDTLLAGKQDTLSHYIEDIGGSNAKISTHNGDFYVDNSKVKMDFGSSTSYVQVDENGIQMQAPNSYATLNGYTLVTTPVLETSLAGKQDTLTFDPTPLQGSNNPVTSNGIYSAIHSWPDKNNIIIWDMGAEATPNLSQHRWIEVTTALTTNDKKYIILQATDTDDAKSTIYYKMRAIHINQLSDDIVSVEFERLDYDVFKGLILSEGTNGTIDITQNGAGRNINNLNIYNYTYSKTVLDEHFGQKQDELVSQQNIKSINNVSILGSGNLTIDTQVQSDWNESDSASKAYILNKPTIPSLVQPNWNESDSASYAYIQNKPTIPAAQINSDWNESDSASKAYILNKPTIPSLVQSNWNESDNTSYAYIQNKPSVYTQSEINAYLGDKQDTLVSGTNIKTINSYSILGSGNIEIQGGGSVTFDNEPTENSYNAAYSGGIYKVITDDELVLAAALNDLNAKIIQPDWDESDSYSYAYIQNKPDLTYMVTSSTTPGLVIEVVSALPANPDADTIYIIQA